MTIEEEITILKAKLAESESARDVWRKLTHKYEQAVIDKKYEIVMLQAEIETLKNKI